MKRIVLFLITLLLGLGLFGCGGSKQQVAGEGKEVKLIIAGYVTPSYEDLHPPMQAFVDYVNEHGKGKVKLEYYHSGTLLKANELLPGLMQGTADLIFHTDSYLTGTYPVLGILELPFLYKDVKDISNKTKIGTPIYNIINQELAKQNLFMIANIPTPPEYIWTTKKPVRTPEDLKGLRIRTAGRIEAKTIDTLKAASTNLSSAELYEALQRGTVDGAMCYLGTIPARSLQEVIEYCNTGYFGAYGEQIYIKLDRWQSLPEDVRDLLIEAGKEYEKGLANELKVHNEKYWPVVKNAGVKVIEPTPAEVEQFRKACKPVWDWWKEQLPEGVGDKAIELANK